MLEEIVDSLLLYGSAIIGQGLLVLVGELITTTSSCAID
jgi:hypothetical protein